MDENKTEIVVQNIEPEVVEPEVVEPEVVEPEVVEPEAVKADGVFDDKSLTREFPAEKPTAESLPAPVGATVHRTPKPYIFYCVLTLSVMLFCLAFTASELFSLFFSKGYPGSMIMTKLFGEDGGSDKSLQEIMLGQSFNDLSLDSKVTTSDIPDTTTPSPIETTTEPAEVTTVSPVTTADTHNTEPQPPDIYAYDPSGIPEGMSGVMPMDLSLTSYGGDYIYNSSSKTPDFASLASLTVSVKLSEVYPAGAPLVLIVHTHGTEAYTAEGVNYYDPDKEVSRSDDKNENVVILGKQLSDYLNFKGIVTLHCDKMFDSESYTGAYTRSGDAIKEYLKKYPSIQYVIDLHRDAVVRSTGELVKPVTLCDGKTAAQVMCVVGTGASGVECKGWQSNLALAQRLRTALNADTAGLCRPACLRDSSYNQQYSTYSLLLEVGAAGNTLEEAKTALNKVAEALAKIITG